MPQPRSTERDVAAPVPARPTLPRLRSAAQRCRACELWSGATQAVMGRGTTRADAMLVGEQPGDREDLEGAPFVGPAGKMLDRGLADVADLCAVAALLGERRARRPAA